MKTVELVQRANKAISNIREGDEGDSFISTQEAYDAVKDLERAIAVRDRAIARLTAEVELRDRAMVELAGEIFDVGQLVQLDIEVYALPKEEFVNARIAAALEAAMKEEMR